MVFVYTIRKHGSHQLVYSIIDSKFIQVVGYGYCDFGGLINKQNHAVKIVMVHVLAEWRRCLPDGQYCEEC